MTDTPLRALLTDLTRDPAVQAEFQADPGGWLASHGHDLSDELVAEAVVSVSAVLPVEVAEHLAPFTIGASPIPPIDGDPAGAADPGTALDGLGLLGSSPRLDDVEGASDPTDTGATGDDHFGSGAGSDPPTPSVDLGDGEPLDQPTESTGGEGEFADAGIVDPLAPLDPTGHESDLDLDGDDATGPAVGDDPADLDGID